METIIPAAAGTLIRTGIALAAGLLVRQGVLDENTAQLVVAFGMAVAVVAWGLFNKVRHRWKITQAVQAGVNAEREGDVDNLLPEDIGPAHAAAIISVRSPSP